MNAPWAAYALVTLGLATFAGAFLRASRHRDATPARRRAMRLRAGLTFAAAAASGLFLLACAAGRPVPDPGPTGTVAGAILTPCALTARRRARRGEPPAGRRDPMLAPAAAALCLCAAYAAIRATAALNGM